MFWSNRSRRIGCGTAPLRGRLLCRCQGPLVLAVAAATTVEELSLRGAFGGPRLLEDLRPMAGTLKVLDIDSVFMYVSTFIADLTRLHLYASPQVVALKAISVASC